MRLALLYGGGRVDAPGLSRKLQTWDLGSAALRGASRLLRLLRLLAPPSLRLARLQRASRVGAPARVGAARRAIAHAHAYMALRASVPLISMYSISTYIRTLYTLYIHTAISMI